MAECPPSWLEIRPLMVRVHGGRGPRGERRSGHRDIQSAAPLQCPVVNAESRCV